MSETTATPAKPAGTYPEFVLARGDEDGEGNVQFTSIFDGDPGFLPGNATLTITVEGWEAMGRPDTIHAYNAG